MTIMELNVKESLCMVKGDGDNSYAKNSLYVRKFVARTMFLMDKVARSLLDNPDISSNKILNIADLGCSTGTNTFPVMSTILGAISNKCKELELETPEIQFHLNDLPSNDFNTLFKGLTNLDHNNLSCFVYGVPGSFYDPLFPSNTIHMVHSSFCLQWLSKIPKFFSDSDQGLPLINKGNIYISEESPKAFTESYISHFEQDFSSFLQFRSEEIVPGGLMFLTIHSRVAEDLADDLWNIYWQKTLSRSIAELVSEGLIDEEKLDEFNMPIYPPSEREVRELVEKEGSFTVDVLEVTTMEIGDTRFWSGPEAVAKLIRAITEPILAAQFGRDLMDTLYDKVAEMIASDWEQGRHKLMKSVGIVVVLRRNKY